MKFVIDLISYSNTSPIIFWNNNHLQVKKAKISHRKGKIPTVRFYLTVVKKTNI